jgi:predicted AAA+ superfamily ATPase
MEQARADNRLMGKVIENFIVTELMKQIGWSKVRPSLFHFRTADGKEVDIILENRAGKLVGIEIKSANKLTQDDFKGLKFLQEKSPEKFAKGIVLYGGAEVIPFGKNLFALPINSLWQ